VINSLGGGGAERSILQVANELHRKGNRVSIVAVNKQGIDLVKPELPVYSLNRDHLSGVFQLLKTIFRFRKLIFDLRPKALVLNCDLPELLGCFVSKSIELFIVEHANPSWRTRKTLGRLVRNYAVRRKLTWIKVSEHLHITFYKDAFAEVIYNPIPKLLMRKLSFSSNKKIKRLVFIGRIEEVQKRPSVVLDASSELDLPCLVIGEGPDLDQLKNYALDRKMNATFKNFIENPWNEIDSGDLLVVPSSYEGDGLVVVEGILQGIPIVLSKIVDFERFKLPKHLYFHDTTGLIEIVRTYSTNLDKLRVPDEIVEKIRESRNIEGITLQWEALLPK
jgi:glycosyltransferase involved in cell wall biosynthesis